MGTGPPGDSGDPRRAHNARQARAHDDVAEAFDGLKASRYPGEEEKLESIVESAQLQAGEAILDVGSGTGALLGAILKAEPSEIVACDLSAKMLELAKAKYGAAVRYVQQDVIDLPGKAGPFDVVFCNAVFGNIYDQQLAIQAIHALLKEGGRLVISHPLGKDFVRRLGDRNEDIKELPDESGLASLLEPEGLSLTEFVDEPEFYLAIAHKV